MRTVLLVEDEPFVRRTLLKQVNWFALGFEVIGESGNGRDALEILVSRRPDVVISDIMMPEINGTELLKKAREYGVDSKFIMLTCLNDFDYARQAIEYGASSYILKLSMSIPELEQKLMKLRLELEEKDKLTLMMQQQDKENLQAIYKQAWTQIILGLASSSPVGPLGIEEKFTYVQIIASASIDADFPAEKEGVVSHHVADDYQESRFYWYRDLEEAIDVVEFPNLVSSGAVQANVWRDAWNEVRYTLVDAWYEGEQTQGERINLTTSLSWDEEKALMLNLDHEKWESFRKALRDKWDFFAKERIDYRKVKDTALVVFGMFRKIFPNVSMDSQAMYTAFTHEDLYHFLDAALDICLNNKKTDSFAYTSNQDVNKIIDYVHLHYGEEISLKTLAEHVALETHYVSILFKKKKGTTITHFIQCYRVQKAKQLLKDTEGSVSEIGQKVGFENDNYFIKIFKRFVNMTPSQYRKES